MSEQSLPLYDRDRPGYGDIGSGKTFAASVVLHAVLLVLIPLLLSFFSKPRKIDRPQTFQLVSAPIPTPPPPAPRTPTPPPPTPPPPTPAPPPPTPPPPAPTPTPTPPRPPEPAPTPPPPTPAPPAPAKQEQVRKEVEENVDALASLLDALPAPVQVSAPQGVSHPYLNIVRQRIENNWRAPTENRNISAVVSFTINSDGSVSNLTVSRSSGNATIDRMARDAVQRASPFGKLPSPLGDKIDIDCTLRPTRR